MRLKWDWKVNRNEVKEEVRKDQGLMRIKEGEEPVEK